MIVRDREDLIQGKNHVTTDLWTSTRFFVDQDNLGFSFHETIINANSEYVLWYKDHVEAVIIVEGEGEIEEVSSGKKYHLKKGSAYAVTGEKHIFRSFSKVVCYCVFNPAVGGDEIPNAERESSKSE